MERGGTFVIDRSKGGIDRLSGQWQNPGLIADSGNSGEMDDAGSYVRKLVTELSGGVFGYLDSVLERHSFDEFGELI